MEGDINLQPSTSTQRKKAKMLALTTPCGHDYHLTLADGTEVWLNAESRLEFPDVFDKSAREVRLHGEAYFQVAKDAKHPFIVQVLPQENSAEGAFRTRVLGTQFNIRAYHPKDISVTLIEGKVCVEAADDKQVLAPHQQWAMHNGMQSVKTVDTYPLTQWKEGFFYFDNQTLLQIMQQLAHWYNVNVAFDDPSKTKVRLHFVTERNNSLAETLRQLNDLHVADISLSHNVIVVK
jgi:ferric-dicitrate binding protein FerR (iron transport regulator)